MMANELSRREERSGAGSGPIVEVPQATRLAQLAALRDRASLARAAMMSNELSRREERPKAPHVSSRAAELPPIRPAV